MSNDCQLSDEEIQELAEARTERRMERVKRHAMLEAFIEMVVWAGYITIPVLIGLALYVGYHGSLGGLVVFAGTALMQVMMIGQLKQWVAKQKRQRKTAGIPDDEDPD